MGKLQLVSKMLKSKAFVLITEDGVDSVAQLPDDNAIYSLATLENLREQLTQYIDFFKTESGLLHLEEPRKRRHGGKQSQRSKSSRDK